MEGAAKTVEGSPGAVEAGGVEPASAPPTGAAEASKERGEAGPSAAPAPPADSSTLLYHEKQSAALCGVHALNTLLQGPYFSEFDLAHIAQELDAMERALLAEAGVDSVDFLMHVGGESANVRDDGMFSIQVLSKALEVWGLAAVPLSSPEASSVRSEPLLGEAYVANLREHWFTLRRVGEEYWNFNSLFSAPEPLSSFYLSAFLGTLQQQGYTVYWIRGQLPVGPHPDAGSTEGPGQWVTPDEARAAQKQAQELKNQGFLQAAYKGVLGLASAAGNAITLQPAGSKRTRSQGDLGAESSSPGGDDPDLARALAASLREADEMEDAATSGGHGSGGGGGGAQEDADLAAAIAASLADQGGADVGAGGGGVAHIDEDEDPELAAAIAASLQAQDQRQQQEQQQEQQQQQEQLPKQPEQQEEEPPPPELPTLGAEPPAGEGVLDLALRLPSGKRVTRRFAASDTLGHVAALAAAEGLNMARHRLARAHPRVALEELGQSLAEAGIESWEMLLVEGK